MAAAPKIATVRRQWDNAISKSCPIKTGKYLLRDGSNTIPVFLFDIFLNLLYNFNRKGDDYMNTLYILCGPSGCGKSTWAKQFCTEHPNISYVSRDSIRFNIVKDEEDYFSHEKEVFREFVLLISMNLHNNDVVADATHLNEFSRRKLTQAIDRYITDYQIVYVAFNVKAEVCIARNSTREGRANVPENIIRNMCRDFRMPSMDEDERTINIIEVGE